MITAEYVRTMAHYNRWQNRSLYGAADGLGEEARKEARGAFFGSIHGTLCHLLWADQMWMSRFAGTPRPKVEGAANSPAMVESWDELKAQRAEFDEVIIGWAEKVDPQWLAGDLTWYSGGAKRELTKPKGILVAHFFNHQTHHRGQVHCLLTQCGAKPDITDLAFGPPPTR